MDIIKKILNIGLKNLNPKLGISNEFIVEIHDENNSWSFISKIAQVIEGFFTQILVQRLEEKDAYKTISNLSQAVRINLACDLKIINEQQKLFFLTIAEIRNDYIHNISNIEVTLFDYFQTLKISRKTEIYKRFKPFLKEEISTSEEFFSNCKDLIFFAFFKEIVDIYSHLEISEASIKHAKFRARQAEQLLPKKADDAMFIEDTMMVIDFVQDAKKILKNSGLLKPKFLKK